MSFIEIKTKSGKKGYINSDKILYFYEDRDGDVAIAFGSVANNQYSYEPINDFTARLKKENIKNVENPISRFEIMDL